MTFAINYNNKTVYSSEWITEQKLGELPQGWTIADNIMQVASESEKAIKVEATLESRYTDACKVWNIWLPKSQLRDTDEEEERMERIATNFTNACEKYEALVAKVQSLDIKIRKRSKTPTIVAKVQEAGKFDEIKDLVKMTKYGWKLA